MSPTHEAADMLLAVEMHLIRLHTPFTYQSRFVPPDMIQNRISDQRLTSDNKQWWRLKPAPAFVGDKVPTGGVWLRIHNSCVHSLDFNTTIVNVTGSWLTGGEKSKVTASEQCCRSPRVVILWMKHTHSIMQWCAMDFKVQVNGTWFRELTRNTVNFKDMLSSSGLTHDWKRGRKHFNVKRIQIKRNIWLCWTNSTVSPAVRHEITCVCVASFYWWLLLCALI